MPYFTRSAPPYILKHLVEREAQRFRAYLGHGPIEPIDAFEVAESMGLDVADLWALPRLSAEDVSALAADDHWSGATYRLPNGIIKIVLNPHHSHRRHQATLMEEVGHVHLSHGQSTIMVDPATGVLQRSYDQRQEQEAYWFGSATLVPKIGLRGLYEQGYVPARAAEYYGVSLELITFRTNLHRLSTRPRKIGVEVMPRGPGRRSRPP